MPGILKNILIHWYLPTQLLLAFNCSYINRAVTCFFGNTNKLSLCLSLISLSLSLSLLSAEFLFTFHQKLPKWVPWVSGASHTCFSLYFSFGLPILKPALQEEASTGGKAAGMSQLLCIRKREKIMEMVTTKTMVEDQNQSLHHIKAPQHYQSLHLIKPLPHHHIYHRQMGIAPQLPHQKPTMVAILPPPPPPSMC